MICNYRYRIYPTLIQKELIEKSIGYCRLVYNLALQAKIYAYKSNRLNLSSFDLCFQLADMKKEYKWLNEVDSQALQAAVKKVDVTFKRFFKGEGYPKFKSKKGKQSFQCPNNTRKIDWDNSTLSIPKIKNIPIVLSRRFEGEIKSIIITRHPSGKYFASIYVNNKKEAPYKQSIEEVKTIGIDLGLADFAILSNGEKIHNHTFLKSTFKKIKRLQRRISRKNRGSNNKKKAIKKLAIQHEKVANRRLDFLHKLSTKIVNDSQVTSFCVEDLPVSNLVLNHKLAASINDVGWGKFYQQLKYKCEWRGKTLITINRFEPSTKTCSNCKAVNETLTLKDRNWTCAYCLSTHDRDINAAINIKFMGLQTAKGIRKEPVELPTLVGAMKQEIDTDSQLSLSIQPTYR